MQDRREAGVAAFAEDRESALALGFRVARDVPWPPGEGPDARDPVGADEGPRAK